MIQKRIGICLFTHQIACTLISGKIIIETIECRLTDTRLFRSTAPMSYIMATAQWRERTNMICIHLTAMACHSLSHTPDITASRPKEIIPQPHRGGEFCIVPGIAAYIIAPVLTLIIISMHDVAIVPESIPPILLYIALIGIDIFHKPTLHSIGRILWQRPYTERPFLIKICWRRKKTTVRSHCHCRLLRSLPARIAIIGRQSKHACTGNTIRRAHALLHIFIAGQQIMSNRIIMAEIHRFSLWTPKIHSQLCFIASG